jgi:hypothetical protein
VSEEKRKEIQELQEGLYTHDAAGIGYRGSGVIAAKRQVSTKVPN